MTAKEDVVLVLDEKAEPNECGSCHFFRRSERSTMYGGAGPKPYPARDGRCGMRLPPFYLRKEYDPEAQQPDTVDDTDGCSLWRSSGKAYIVSHRVTP